ncbi:MAG: ABC transporter substrate-binding protein [Gammaproteobacteria bacterium]
MRTKYLFFLLLFFCGTVWASTAPVQMLQQVSDEIIVDLQQSETRRSDLNYIYNLVEEVLIPHVDVEGFARSAVGRQVWQTLEPSQQQRFSHVLMRLVIRTYSKALTYYTSEEVKFYPIKGSIEGKRFVQVKSLVIRKQTSNIPLTYNLVLKDNHWKIYNLCVEGVCLLQSFNAQIDAALSKGSFEDLIDKLTERSVAQV